MKSSALLLGLFWALFFWLNFQVSDSAVCSSLTQGQCDSASGCLWSGSYCSCASNVTMDLVFALDSSGSIGSSSFQTALSWMEDLVQSGITQGARVGIIKFSTDTDILLTLEDSENYSTQQLVDLIAGIYYDAGYTNTVQALDDAIAMYQNQGNPYAKYVLLLITDGDPCCDCCVASLDVCSRASTLKSMGIQVVIIGVGSGWNPAKVDCLVTDDSDIIPVDQYSQSAFETQVLPTLSTITCPVTYNLIITEAQIDTVDSSTGSRFIEVYNPSTPVRLSDLSISGVFTGTVSSGSTTTLSQGNYMVFYDGSAPDLPSCQDCSCSKSGSWCSSAVYVECCNSGCACKFVGGHFSNTNWTFTVTDSTNQEAIDSLTYDMNTWPQILKGYSYELKYVGYDNQKGDNWQQSCNVYGTPGSDPIRNCSWTCTAQQCQVSGAGSAVCSGDTCDCNSNSYYFSGTTCKKVPPPGVCYAYWLKDANTSARSVQFVWEAAQTDQSLKYALTYFTKEGSSDVVTTSSRVKSVNDFDYSRGTYQRAGRVNTTINGATSTGVDCWPKTMHPTAAPTFHPPVVYLSGDICSVDRCNCSGKDFYTCTGPQIEKSFAADNLKTQFVTVRKWPTEFDTTVRAFWEIWFFGDYDKPDSETKVNADIHRKDEDIVDGQKRFFEARGFKEFNSIGFIRDGRTLLTTFSSTTAPNVTASPSPGLATGITPSSGLVNISASEIEDRIGLMIWKADTVAGQSKYRLYVLNITNCTDEGLQPCTPVYPSTLYMIVDITGGAEVVSSNKTQKEMPTWLWWLIGGLVILAALLTLLGYRYWWRSKQATEELKETNAELNAAREENELGFGRDLAVGDVQFNPIATGIPNTTVAPQLNTDVSRAGLMAFDGKADVAVEKFKHREEFGQRLPDKRGRPPPPPPGQ